MKDRSPAGLPTRLLALGTILFLTAGVWLAAALAVLIARAAPGWGSLGAFLLEKGPEKIMRRCLLGVGLVFLLAFLRRAGWRGWRDCGWLPDDPGDAGVGWRSDLLRGLLLGILSLGAVGGLTILARIHPIVITDPADAIARAILGLLLSGAAVALIEETLMRGILFRVLARGLRAWPAAILSSLAFAAAHFAEPARAAFDSGPFLLVSARVALSTFRPETLAPLAGIKFLNLALLGLVLCAFVIRTRTIWLAVGAHAGWVWMIKLHGLLTLYDPAAPLAAWLGRRNDFMDSILATAFLGALLAWAARRPGGAGTPLRRAGVVWRVAPDALAEFRDWLARRDTAAPERLLKAYPGCRVIARGGVVFKTKAAGPGLAGWRFGLRPSRSRRTFALGRALSARGIPTPAPLAWATRRVLGLRRADYGATREVADAAPLTDWLARRPADPAACARVMASYGRLMAGFHQAGYSNRDLKHENVLCPRAAPWDLWVIDLDGVRRRPWITRRRAARDLRRIGLSLRAAGALDSASVAAFFEAYKALVPARLRRRDFPI